jgi:adenylate cyclase class 2
MNIEYEATFTNINKDKVRQILKKNGAALVKNEYLQRRTVFTLPGGKDLSSSWLRVRDEGGKITMSLKVVDGDKITDQKEICLEVSDYNEAVALLKAVGCQEKAYQETKRELWKLDGVEITIDEWPFLEPFMEVEGRSEEEVKRVSEKLGFDWDSAKFCAIGTLYKKKYGISLDEINNNTPKIVFKMKNPFINKAKKERSTRISKGRR